VDKLAPKNFDKVRCPYLENKYCILKDKRCFIDQKHCSKMLLSWRSSPVSDPYKFRHNYELLLNSSLKNGFFGMDNYFDKRIFNDDGQLKNPSLQPLLDLAFRGDKVHHRV